tara:strand:- start:419 stop:622 length:204 start_codon:yes stop_codon:yes gene_type:complete
MGKIIYFPEDEELKNFRLMKVLYSTKEKRNKKARKKFFSWWKTELKKFVKDAQDMIKDAKKKEKNET